MLSDKTAGDDEITLVGASAPAALPDVVTPQDAHSMRQDSVPALDGVRAIAILLVLFHHFMAFAPLTNVEQSLFAWTKYAWFGVDLFFVLSGFLITRILIKAKESPHYFKSFFARRCLRIWPLYYGFLLLVFVLLPVIQLHLSPTAEKHQWWFWVNLQNFYFANYGFHDRTTNPMWSLAIEEQFYLMWPFCVRFLPKRAWLPLLGTVILGSVIARVVLFAQGTDPLVIYVSTFTHLDTIAIGCFLAVAMSYERFIKFSEKLGKHENALFVATLLGFLGFLACKSDWRDQTMMGGILGYSLVAALSALLIFTAMVSSKRCLLLRFLENPFIVLVGKISFGIYVIHRTVEHLFAYFLFPFFEKYVPQAPSIALMTSLCAITFLVALASYHFYEMRFLKLKRYFEYVKPKREQPAQ